MRFLVNKTYNEFYGKFSTEYNPEEFMECVDALDIVERFEAELKDT